MTHQARPLTLPTTGKTQATKPSDTQIIVRCFGYLRHYKLLTLGAYVSLLAITALEYLHRSGRPRVNVRFDIVEVLCDSEVVVEVRHLENAFTMPKPYRYD